jgi:hypothetical protein
MAGRYYSPQLDRSLISPLYHAAKAAGVPMTRLASQFVSDGLSRIKPVTTRSALAEEPPEPDSTQAE